MADTQAPPAPTESPDAQSVYTPTVPPVTAAWQPLPSRAGATDTEPKPRRQKRGGLPVGPALLGGANATSLATTAAYAAGGWPAMAVAGGGAVALTVAAAVRRRSTVSKRKRERGTWQRAGSGSTGRGRGYSSGTLGASGGGRGRAQSGSQSRGGRAAGAGRHGGAAGSLLGGVQRKTLGLSAPGSASPRGASPAGGRRGRGGAGPNGSDGLRRTLDRITGGSRGGPAKRGGKDTGPGGQTPRDARKAARLEAKRRLREQRATMPPSRSRQLAAAAARKTREAWAKPGSVQARAALRKRLRHAAGASHDGAAALLRGALTAGWKFSLRAGLERLREVWRRRRDKRAAKNTPAAPEKTVGAAARRPASTTTPPATSTGGTAVSGGHHFTGPAMEMARAAAAYEPTGMMQVGQDFANLPEALELVAEAMKVSVEKADGNQPLDPQIVDMMRGIWELQMKAAEMARELKPAFENLHAADIARHVNPRKGPAAERMWDIAANDGIYR